MSNDYFILDIETRPLDLDYYLKLKEEDALKLLNPIDSKIVAIGIRHNSKDVIYLDDDDEKKILDSFWTAWRELKKYNVHVQAVGFNVKNFDLPFLTARSFIHKSVIAPFLVKNIIDIREKISAYRYGETRGKLKDFAKLIGLDILDIDGGDIAKHCRDKRYDDIRRYLAKDLEITDEIYKRLVETNIIQIERW
jgi:uncharacterized protein YprB with RNaseH-like and TPR domain